MTTKRLAMLPVLLALSAGCDDTPKSDGAPKIKARETIGKTTQNVMKQEDAVQQGAVLADTKIPVADPLTQNAAAYRTSVAKIGAMAVEQAIQLRNAQSIDNPKDLTYDEFMAEIIKKDQPDGIRLPMLPYYQEYIWHEELQKLVVVDFPERKAQLRKQMDKELGRD